MKESIDYKIAREVMCWHLSPSGKAWRDCNGDHMDLVYKWNPSENIYDAFRVIAKMQKLGFSPGMQSNEGKWEATMRSDWASPYYQNTWEQRTKDPAMAICLSALQWIRNPKA